MTTITGIIDSVKQVMLGSTLDADAAIGATVLTLVDSSDFDGRTGGTVVINGTNYPYIGVDSDNELLTLGTPLTAAATQDDPVLIWDSVTSSIASEVQAGIMAQDEADAQGDAIIARVNLSLIPLLPLGPRDPGNGEVAKCEIIDDEWVLTDLPGATPLIRGELMAPGSITPAGLGFALPGGGSVFVGSTAPTSPANGDLWVYVNPSDPTTNAIFKWDSSTSTWGNLQVGTNSIATGSITADLLAANAIVAGKIAAGALDALSVIAGTLTAGSISSGNIGSSILDSSTITDTRYILRADDSTGAILVYSVSGTTTVLLTTTGTGNWIVPAGVTSVKAECWAGGGAGAGNTPNSYAGQAGGGGEYARENSYAVTPGASIPYQVGAGGLAHAGAAGDNGLPTYFDGTAGVYAHPGNGGGGLWQFSYAPGGTGSTNSVHFTGGNGHNATGSFGTAGGGAGSGAGSAKSGTDGGAGSGSTGGSGGVAPTGGGNGGKGGDYGPSGNVGVAGSAPGGGGGGAGSGPTGSTAKAGGAGARGQIKLTYGGALVLVASIAGAAGTDPYGNAYPAGVMVFGTTITDWNLVKQPGFWSANGTELNSPKTGAIWSGYVYARPSSPDNSITQILTRLTSGDAPEVWCRQYSDTNGWRSWKRMFDDVYYNSTAGITAGTGATISNFIAHRIGGVCSVYISLTVPTITVPASGNVTNTKVATITDPRFIPSVAQAALLGGSAGPVTQAYIDTSGDVYITATSGGAAYTSGAGQVLIGTYTIDPETA